jgi:hypothetical protein
MIQHGFSSANEKVLAKSVFFAVIVFYLLVLPSVGNAAGRIDYKLFMYKSGEVGKPTALFEPNDKVVVYIKFLNLLKGEYVFHADWHNPLGELQDSSKYSFAVHEDSDYAVEASLTMSKAGLLTRLFSASETTGYSIKFYGKWQVKLFLNGDEVAGKSFEVK